MERTKSPRDRILEAAAKLFHREATHTVTLDRIVAKAGTTKMAFYRHFEGREALVAEWLTAISTQSEARWEWLAAEHPYDPIAQIVGWARFISSRLPSENHRGCPFMNTAAELSDPNHPAWGVIREHRDRVRQHLESLCRKAHLSNPERLSRGILYVVDGAQSNASNLGADLVGEDMVEMVSSLIGQRTSLRSTYGRAVLPAKRPRKDSIRTVG